MLFLVPLLLMMFSSLRVDSEVGTMAYGLNFIFASLVLLPFLVFGVLLWTIGIYKKPVKKIPSTFEKRLNFFFIIFTGIALLFFCQNIDVNSLLRTILW